MLVGYFHFEYNTLHSYTVPRDLTVSTSFPFIAEINWKARDTAHIYILYHAEGIGQTMLKAQLKSASCSQHEAEADF